MVAMPSDIQVFVKWKEQTIFAGEDVECVITFKNVADGPGDAANGPSTPQHARRASRSLNGISSSGNDGFFTTVKSPASLFFGGKGRSLPQSPRRPADRSHRVSASLNSPLGGSNSFPPLHTPPPRFDQSSGHRHKRSVSILSIESDTGSTAEKTSLSSPLGRPGHRGHGRSVSVQIHPRRGPEDPPFSPGPRTPTIRGPPFPEINVGPTQLDKDALRSPRPGPLVPSPRLPLEMSRSGRGRPPLPTDFKFPMTPPPASESSVDQTTTASDRNPSSRPSSKSVARDPPSLTQQPHLLPATKILSTSSANGSTRSSGEFYTLSNNSTETLESEYTNYGGNRPRMNIARHRRHYSGIEPVGKSRDAVTLLMGYAQISASFTVDGSLINQAAFDEVKRKGVVGGQSSGSSGAGGAEKSRRSGGLLGALGWNVIEDSLSGLLSNGDLNGLRDMRGVTSSKSIPLLSTPQSLLFVDLRLGPGEESSYSFSFTLPRGLPASHKGKAIKISYNLIIGTQRPSGPKQVQQVNRINIPFRVFSGVNAQGDVLGHDLMSPYVLLRDEARVQKLINNHPRPAPKEKSISGPTWTNATEFLSYVDEILAKPRQASITTSNTPLERVPSAEQAGPAPSCKDAIDLAILRSNQIDSANRSANRFEIARNGRRIAVVVLNRPAHRLGETVLATIDFTDAALPCYSLRATLETSEKVDPSIAVRSSASIHRATRRVHASYFENTLFATRVVFSPAIPITATPTLLTSGVRLVWELRFEFVTLDSAHDEEGLPLARANLLDTIGEDERGRVFSAVETLPCESFEVAIPLTVYGETVREPSAEESEGYPL